MTTLRCCACGTPEVLVVLPGAEHVTGPGGIIVQRGEPMRSWCETHARAAGWPWLESERTQRTGQQELAL